MTVAELLLLTAIAILVRQGVWDFFKWWDKRK